MSDADVLFFIDFDVVHMHRGVITVLLIVNGGLSAGKL